MTTQGAPTERPAASTPSPARSAGPPVDDVAGMKTAGTGGVVRAGVVMAVATLISRATGFLAKVVLVTVLGFSAVNDAYTLANTLPNIVFELLIGGVLTSVAVPLLSRARSDPDGGELYTQRLMTIALVGLLVATALAVLAAPLLTGLYLSGGDGVVDVDLANHLAYLLLPQIFFYGMAALFGAILNTKEKFGVPAWAPVANNLVVIGVGIALLLISADTQTDLVSLTTGQLLLLGIGTTAGIVLQAVVMLPSLHRSGFRFRWRWGGDRRLLEAGGLLLWAVAYVLVSQVGYVVITNVASDNVVGGITFYAFASMLFQLPYGIIGVSILTAIMPRMSRHAAAGQLSDVKDDASLASRLSIVALTPVAAGIIALAGALAVITSNYGNVSLDDTVVLGATLAALAFGLVPFAVTLVQMRVFYAMKDARTPTIINAIMVAVRVPLLVLCASLDDSLVIPGMAVATSISYLAGAIAGEIWLRARYGPMGTRRTLVTLVKMTVAGAAGAGAALLVSHQLLGHDVDGLGDAIVEVLVGGIVGLAVIAVLAVLFKVDELVPVRNRVAALVSSVTRRIFRRGAPNPGASTDVQHTGRGTLDGEQTVVLSAAALQGSSRQGDPLDSRQSDRERRVAFDAATVVSATHSKQQPNPREQVSRPVPNDSGGPSVRGLAGAAEPDLDRVDNGSTANAADDAEVTEVLRSDGPMADPEVTEVRHPAVAGRHDASQHDASQHESEETTIMQTVADDPAADDDSTADHTLPVTSTQLARAERDDPAAPLAPGTTVGGRYRLVSLVSADASGHWFWRAKDTVLPRDMAVTMLPDNSGASATVARTLRAGRLHHIGLPQTLDVGTDFGQSYVVGQWVDGATLTDLLAGGPLDPDVATSITAKLSEAVAEAHRNGIAFGALSPSLVRVNFDGQVRLSHVIAHGSATPDQDIRAIGALLYLMLTGSWPLGDPIKPGGVALPGGELAANGQDLPAAPTRLGRELPADEVNQAVPEALSALAERALHPEEPDGIHAVGAIAALLRSPETVAGTAQPPPVTPVKPLSPADRRLIKERRVKLSLAAVVLAVFAVLIVIALGGLTNQFVASVQNSAPDELPMIDSGVSSAEVAPTPSPDPGTVPGSTTAAPAAPAVGPVPIVGGSVFDPQGDGTPDYKDYVDRAFDGNPDSAWLTWVYKAQFPSLKTGVGLMLELDHEVTPTSVTVTSATKGTVIEVRSATSPTATLEQTTSLGSGTVANGTATIALTNAPKSKYLVVFVTQMTPTSDKQFQSKINEIAVQGS
ncbi:MAG: murein biosynthesis integral membrane protein MurJ [Nakamurella sp.]